MPSKIVSATIISINFDRQFDIYYLNQAIVPCLNNSQKYRFELTFHFDFSLSGVQIPLANEAHNARDNFVYGETRWVALRVSFPPSLDGGRQLEGGKRKEKDETEDARFQSRSFLMQLKRASGKSKVHLRGLWRLACWAETRRAAHRKRCCAACIVCDLTRPRITMAKRGGPLFFFSPFFSYCLHCGGANSQHSVCRRKIKRNRSRSDEKMRTLRAVPGLLACGREKRNHSTVPRSTHIPLSTVTQYTALPDRRLPSSCWPILWPLFS